MLSYVVLVFVFFALIAMSAYLIERLAVSKNNNHRYQQITTIYTSLRLDNSYRPVKTNVFGDKRAYNYDKGRTESSSVEYGRNATSEETLKDITSRARAAGFSEAGSAYEGSIAPQYYFKNDAGNYLRVTIEPKAAHDAAVYGTEPSVLTPEERAQAPVYVTVKVNLDDNNE